MSRSACFSLALACAALVACKPAAKAASSEAAAPATAPKDSHPHAVRGTVDSIHPLTIEEVAQLGVEEAKKKYLGKIVTFKGLNPVGVSAKNEQRKNVCMQGFGKWFKPKVGLYISGDVRVYFNFGDEIVEWDHKGEYLPENLETPNLLQLQEDVCDTAGICNEGDAQDERKCLFASEKFLITGKIIWIGTDGDRGFKVDMRPTGLRY